MTSPFAYTEEEIKMMRLDYKKPKAKKWFVAKKENGVKRLNNESKEKFIGLDLYFFQEYSS